MKYWLEKGWHYWEGPERPGADAIEISQRLNDNNVWDGNQWQDNSREHYIYDVTIPGFKLKEQIEIDKTEIQLNEVEAEKLVLNNARLAKIFWILGKAILALDAGNPLPTDFIVLKDKIVQIRNELNL